jgi:hypothetical protein
VTNRPSPDPLAYGPSGYRCGCGKDAHSNLTPCRPNPPYTEGDLRAEAARYVGTDWDGLEVTAAMADRPHWKGLSDDLFQEAFGAVVGLVEGAVDLSRYAVDCGAEGLSPVKHRLVRGVETNPVCAAFHVALDPHLELNQRAYDEIADIIRNNLAFREEGNHEGAS